ncbi:PhnD/SsuA/transferrin family substrate-binding protein [Aureimonas sp. Leaf454]|uniref:phosphate/phosphite/phosphonate ABC transporter substrate-binding protein n=1 Tax=Aureimonas sp. Leaf454 TaxID=1736381 RepID=UPI000A69D217|nr:PhnD/SsuA/transferrin family substrate-binding protein [Aureimonas sp. Leaf454]
MTPIANARMYAATPRIEATWETLLEHVAADAGVPLAYLRYPAPQPLEPLWRRADLGAVLMCGYPIALGLADIRPIAAPVPAASWAGGAAIYRTELVVRTDAPYERLEDTFGGRIGWTAAHSHSGFNAVRHHLLRHRTARRPHLYAQSVGDLVTPRRVLDAVLDGTIDIGPLDAYWHLLMRRHEPGLVSGIRVLDVTETAPMPAFVAAPALSSADRTKLAGAFADAAGRSWFPPIGEALAIEGFRTVGPADFQRTLAFDRAAVEAGYRVPA